MTNLLLVIVDLWVLGGLVLLTHYRSRRWGFVPFLLLVGALTVLLSSQVGIYIQPVQGFILSVNANVMVPVILMSVLVLYVTRGSVPARLMIFGILGIAVLVLVILQVYRLHLALPGGSTFSPLRVNAMADLNARTTLASLVAFAADMFVIAVFYQGIKNVTPYLPEWISVGLALLIGLWTDSILFQIIAEMGNPGFVNFLAGDVLGKTLSAVALWPLLGGYMAWVAPRQPGYLGVKARPTFDIFSRPHDESQVALIQTQAALLESQTARHLQEVYTQQIADHISEGLWLAEPGRLQAIYVNAAYERIWGRSAAAMVSDDNAFVDSLHPEDRARVIAGIPSQVTGNYVAEFRILRPDSSVRWIRDRAFPVRDERGDIYQIVGISEDITERREMEKHQLELAVEQEKIKLLRDFISEFTHDLKTPLTAINLKIYHLTRTDDPTRRAQLVDELNALSSRMGTMIDDLLTLTRLENIIELTLQRLNVNQLLIEICDSVRPLIEAKQLSVIIKPTEASPIILGDRDDLMRALTNLIDNAVRYTPANGAVSVQTRVRNADVVIEVRDTGIGIPAEEQPKIFNRFFRASNARTMVEGTGLGLAIVKKVIEQHNGHIELVSAPGEGTQFRVYLPLAPERPGKVDAARR
jgi:PAS domain S-box-containing protein